MANPFDEVMESGNKKEGVKVEKETKNAENIRVSFSINKRWFERLFYLAIIIVLGYFAFINPIEWDKPWQKAAAVDEVQNDSAEVTAQAEATEKAEETLKTAEKTEEKKEETEETQEAAKETEKSFKYNFDFVILNISYEEDEDGNPLSMNEMKISMVNRWKDFTARIEVYWYDDKAENIIINKVRLNKELGKISAGKKYTFTLRKGEFDSRYFYPEEKEETIKVILYEEETGIKRKTLTQTLT